MNLTSASKFTLTQLVEQQQYILRTELNNCNKIHCNAQMCWAITICINK